MSNTVLYLVQALSNQKGVNEEVIFEGIEQMLEAATARRYDEDVRIRVEIDRDTCEYQSYRCWEVVEDSDEPLELPGQQIMLSVTQADEATAELQVGDQVEEMVEPVDFGRIDALQARNVLMQKVREAERDMINAQYQKRLGEMVMGQVKRVTREFLVLDLGENAEALLPREKMIPREMFRMNERARVYIESIREERRGPQVLVSRTAPGFLAELFKMEVPEIGEEVIEVMAVSRDPGARAKIAVKTNDGRIDPIGACVGMRGSRVQAVSNELNGERVDIILWDASPAQLVINAMAPAEVVSIIVDEDKHSMDISVAEEKLSLAIGRGGQNIRLASELTGWKLNVMSEAEAAEKNAEEALRLQQLFIEKLDVDETIANALVADGFTSVAALAMADSEELQRIDGFEAELVEELQSRANDVMLIDEIAGDDESSDTLLSVDGVTVEMSEKLTAHGVVTREDLAEQSIDELQEMIEIDDEAAGKLIMSAREHWFK